MALTKIRQEQGVIINDGSTDVDFRVESNGNANMLFVDGGTDRIGIGTASPTSVLDIVGSGEMDVNIRRTGTLSNNNRIGQIMFKNDADSVAAINAHRESAEDDAYLTFNTQAASGALTERMRIHSSGVVSAPYGIELGSGLDATAANTLTDYEEGTWTAGIAGATMSANNTTGYYRKVGRLVSVSWYSGAANFTNTTGGTAQITGLPFTSSHANQHFGGGFLPHTNAFTHICYNGYVNNNSTVFIPDRSDAPISTTTFPNHNTKYIMLNAVYMTAES